jgi:hypothetical protein
MQVQLGVNGKTDQAFMTIPDGLSIEIVEDKNQKVPIRHRNIQFSVTNPRYPKSKLGTRRFLVGREEPLSR